MTLYVSKDQFVVSSAIQNRSCLLAESLMDLTKIYDDQISLAVLKLKQCDKIEAFARILAQEEFKYKSIVSADDFEGGVDSLPNIPGHIEAKKRIAELVEVFSTLFELNEVGLRLSGSLFPMCPKFHVDHIPCRLVYPLYGLGSDWYSHNLYFTNVSHGATTLKKWIHRAQEDEGSFICQTPEGAAVFMKGTGWSEESLPVIHRSPRHNSARLVLTLDFV